MKLNQILRYPTNYHVLKIVQGLSFSKNERSTHSNTQKNCSFLFITLFCYTIKASILLFV